MLNRTLTISDPPKRPELPRLHTDAGPSVTEDVVQYYKTGIFADPKPQRSLITKALLYTDGHKRLVQALREECQKLYAHNRNLRGKAASAESKALKYQSELTDMRQAFHAQSAAMDMLRADLEVANQAMVDMDTLVSTARNKRYSRMSQAYSEDVTGHEL